MTNLSGANLNNGFAVGSKSEGRESPSNTFAVMPKYEAYKESGVEWLGSIPESWDLKPGLVAFSENKRNNKGMKEDTVLSLSYGKIIIKPEEKLVGLVPESFETYQLVEPSDIIVRCTDLQNDKVSLRTGLAKDKGIITSAYLNLKVKSGFNSRFLHYYLHALDTTKVIYKFGSGLRQNLSFLDFKRLPVFDIPEETQEAIANFLDQKTAQIDEAIAIKEKQIALLKERKQIIIQKAVTQGLNPDVPMKDSGVDWVGKIPAYWEVFSLKRLVAMGLLEFQDGNHGEQYPKESEFMDEGVPFLKPRDIKDDYIHWTGADRLPRSRCEKFRIGFAKQGDILLVNRGGTIGKTTHIKKIDDGFDYVIINPQLTYIRAKGDLSSDFFSAICKSDIFQNLINLVLGYGSTFPFLGLANMGRFSVPMPPKKEQVEIAERVAQLNNETLIAISYQVKQIEKLKEYKATLINSAVTGKIKVA